MSGQSPNPTLHEESNISKKWTCIECNQVFSQSKLLETHAVDTDHKAYRCTKERACGKVFTLRPSWIRHERSHSARKTHACYRCAKKFNRKDHCHGHERTCGRVARRARVSSKSTSMSPTTTTTTSSGSTESGTPVDLLTTVLHEEEPSHAAEAGYGGLESFDPPDATIQRGNWHDYGKDDPSIFRQLISVPTKSTPASSAAIAPTMNNGPTQSWVAAFHDTTVSHPLEPENDTLLSVDNTEIPTASRSTTTQHHTVNDWRLYYQFFQSPYDAPSPDLQHTEDNWVIAPEIQASTFYGPSWGNLGYSHSYQPTNSTAGSTRRYNSHVGSVHGKASSINCGIFLPDAHVTVGTETALPDEESVLNSNMDTNISHSSEPKPESTPRSKIATFFSKLKAYIKAPFRKYKQ